MSNTFPVTHSILSSDALAREILPAYDIGTVIDIRLLSRGLNDTYEILVVSGDKFILRVYRTGWRTVTEVAYEIELLNHLAHKGVPVSKPLMRRDSSYMGSVNAPEGERLIVLFSYAIGKEPPYLNSNKSPNEGTVEAQALAYGSAVARVHEASVDFVSVHRRDMINWERLIEIPMRAIHPMLSHRPDDWDYLQRLTETIYSRLDALPIHLLEQGVCHGDFNGGNAHLSDNGVLTFFDFDCCGWGWRAYDLAVYRWNAMHSGGEKKLWPPFLQGYTAVRKIDDVDLRSIPLFVGIRQIWLIGLHTGNGHDWGFGWMSNGYFTNHINFLKKWEIEHCAEMSSSE